MRGTPGRGVAFSLNRGSSRVSEIALYLSIIVDRVGGPFHGARAFFFRIAVLLRLLRAGFAGAGAGDLWLPVLFAAEDEGRTEEPTERKRQKEREKGRVPKSPDIPSSLVTVGGLVVLFVLGTWMLGGIADIMRRFLGGFTQMPALGHAELIQLFISLSRDVGILVAPVFLIAMIMAIGGNLVQVGFLFTLKPLQPDFSRIKLDFPSMMRKVFFSRQIAVNLIKTLLKVGFLAWISYFIITGDLDNLLKLGSMSVPDAVRTLSFTAFKLSLILAIVMFLLALPDYYYQRFEFTESIKMTREEVRQETKETEGDPLIRQRRRQRAYEMYRRNMMGEVKQSDVVITNPTHYAIALRYDPDLEEAPRVIAKGEDHLALIIRNLAKRNEIPIIENKPLARELYDTVPEGELVPEQFYRVLIDIFLNIEGMRARLSRRAG